tara:strand:- start:190 stop:501 length:312 start_codon:yes stop_codon:yes gene_type:complete
MKFALATLAVLAGVTQAQPPPAPKCREMAYAHGNTCVQFQTCGHQNMENLMTYVEHTWPHFEVVPGANCYASGWNSNNYHHLKFNVPKNDAIDYFVSTKWNGH